MDSPSPRIPPLHTLIPASWADPEKVQPLENLESTLVPGTLKRRQPRTRELVRFVALIGTLDIMALIWTLSPLGLAGGAARIATWIAPWADHPLAPYLDDVGFTRGAMGMARSRMKN